MAFLDPLNDTVVVRIVYDGAPLSGKTTSVRALAAALGGDVVVPEELAGRTLYFDWLDYTGGVFEGHRIRCQIVSVPGQTALAARRRLLLASADAIVFVGDSTPEAHASSCDHLADLRGILAGAPGPPVGVVLQANKRDHPDAIPLPRMREMLTPTALSVALVESIATTGLGVREAFVFGVRLALDRVRELMHDGQLPTSRPDVDSADELLEQMRGLEPEQHRSAGAVPAHARSRQSARRPVSITKALDALLPPRRTRRRTAPATGEPAPTPPGASLASGMIWPPVAGRVLLHEANPSGTRVDVGRDGDWSGVAATGWVVHSAAPAAFASLDDARAALLEWARLHSECGDRLSTRRCLAIADDGRGQHRLWQIVAGDPSLRDAIGADFEGADAVTTAHGMVGLAAGLLSAANKWTGAPCRLGLSLRKISADAAEPRYLGLMPLPTGDVAADPVASAPADVARILRAELAFALPAVLPAKAAVIDAVAAVADDTAGPHTDGARRCVRELLDSL